MKFHWSMANQPTFRGWHIIDRRYAFLTGATAKMMDFPRTKKRLAGRTSASQPGALFSYREHEPSPLPPFVAHEGWLNISTLAISHKANSEMFVFLYVNVSYFKQLDTTLPTEQHLVVVWKNPGLQSTWSWATLAVAILLGGESPWPTIRFGRVWHVFCWPMLDFRHMMFELFELS